MSTQDNESVDLVSLDYKSYDVSHYHLNIGLVLVYDDIIVYQR